MTVKTDRKDACGLAQLLRMGWFQQVHAKSIGSQEIRALLVARKQLLGRLLDVELSIRGILRGFGLKVGQVTRKTFEARVRELVTGHAVDDPSRIAKSKAVGALFGLTPKKYQSGEKDVTGGITRTGDEMVRTALYEAANVLLSRITRFSKLKRWGMDVAKRRGSKRAKVALARKIGVILHRMWIDGTTYRWAETKPIAAQG
jgi:transposase